MTGKITLENRRILVTEIPEGIGNDITRGLISKKATVIAFAKSPEQVKDLEGAYPTLIPILLEVTKCPEASRRILSKLPYLDHIVNFSGPAFDSLIGSFLKHYRTDHADLRTTKADDVISKLILAGSRSTVVNFSDTGSNQFSGSSASLAATQFTDALRSSFRKLFRGKTVDESSPKSHEPAKRSSTVPLSTGQAQSQNGHKSSQESAPKKLSLRLSFKKFGNSSTSGGGTLSTNDKKLKKSLTKAHKEFRKVWERKLKKLKSKEAKKLSDLQREIARLKKQEMAAINESNAAVNAATLSRAGALSEETANKIVASRERKAEKDASKLAEKKFVEKKVKLEEEFAVVKVAAVEKHYQKILKRQNIILDKLATNQRQNVSTNT